MLLNETTTVISVNETEVVTHRKCVKSCKDFPGFIKLGNRCLRGNVTNSTDVDTPKEDVWQQLGDDFSITWLPILLSCIAALIFSYILLVLLRYATKYVIWIIMIGIIVFFLALTVLMLVGFGSAAGSNNEDEKGASVGFLIGAGVFFIFAMVATCLVCCFRKRISMVIQIFKEASKALADVPMVLVEPILTFLALALTSIATVFFMCVIYISGKLVVTNDEHGTFKSADYEPDIGISIAFYMNIVGFIWFTQFIFGCQHFVIGGTVVQWFFTRTKDKLDSPLKRSFNYLLRFHIGSVCFGSILITVVKIVRMIMNYIQVSDLAQQYLIQFTQQFCIFRIKPKNLVMLGSKLSRAVATT